MNDNRYEVRPVKDENCGSLILEPVLLATDDLVAAKAAAEKLAAEYQFGVGIEDAANGLIDVGFGWMPNDPR